jgi:hypothetical protein
MRTTLNRAAGRHLPRSTAEAEGFDQQQDDDEDAWGESLVDQAYGIDDDDGSDTRAEIEAASQRPHNTELSALVAAHPELADEETARTLTQTAAGVAQQYASAPRRRRSPGFWR